MFFILSLTGFIACALCNTQKLLRRQDYAFSKYHTRFPTIEELDSDAFELFQKGCATGTIKLWTGHAIEWKEFCDYYKLNDKDFSEEQLVRYMIFGFRVKGNASETERNHAYAIRKLAHQLGRPIDITKENMPYFYGIRKARELEKPPKEGSRIINNDLLQIWFQFETFSVHHFDSQILRGAFAFANNCIRRSAEVLQESFDGLRVGNIYFDNGTHIPTDSVKAALVVFHFSKANQSGKEQSASLFHWCKRGYICCLCEIIRIYKWRKQDWNENTPIFQLANGAILKYDKMHKTIKSCCIEQGIDPDQFDTHGLRGGATYDQRMLGIGDVSRECVAGWKGPQTRIKYDRKIEPIHLLKQMAREAGVKLNPKTTFNYVNKVTKQKKTKLKLKNKRKEKQIKVSNAKLRQLRLLPPKSKSLFDLLANRL